MAQSDQRSTRRSGTSTPNVVPSEAQPIAYITCEPTKMALQGIIDVKSRWQQSDHGSYVYGDPKRTYVAMGDPRPSSPPLEPAAALSQLLELDESDAQTLLFVMARDLSGDGIEKGRMHVNELLEFKGYKRDHSGDFRPYAKREEQRRLVGLSNIWIAVDDEIRVRTGSRTRKKRIREISRLIDVVIQEDQDAIARDVVRSADVAETAPVPYAFRVGLGEWAKGYRRESTLLRSVFATIGKYDATHETQRYAMLLAFALMFRDDGTRDQLRIRELLSEARIELPTHHAERFRQYVEDALDRLRQDGLIGEWRFVAASEEDLPTRRWFEKWLDWEVAITSATSQIASPTPAIATKQRARKASSASVEQASFNLGDVASPTTRTSRARKAPVTR